MRLAHPLLLASLLVSGTASADWRKISSRNFPLKAPPTLGSAESEKDYQELFVAEASRTEADCRLGAAQARLNYESFFLIPESPLPADEAKRAQPLVEKVMAFAERVADFHKDKFRRPRPYDVRPSLKPCVPKPGGSLAYPSSHAVAATAAACVLGAAFPEKLEALKAYGAKLGERRVLVGVHHPSDVAAGAALGADICETLLRDDGFQSELEDILTAGH